MSENALKEKIERFKQLVKQGCPVRKALLESKLQPRDYRRVYSEIWSDPDMQAFRPKHATGSDAAQPPAVVESERRLRELGVGEVPKSEFEKEVEELELKRKSLLRAAEKAWKLYRGTPPPGAPSPSAPATAPTQLDEQPKERDIIAEFEEAYRDFESTRSKIKETLERMGLKVEDMYMKRDEVEKLVEVVRQRAAEDALDDRRIDAASKIVDNAVARIIELFKPAVQRYFASVPEESEKDAGAGAGG